MTSAKPQQGAVWPRSPVEIRINNAFALWFGVVRRPAVFAPIIKATTP